MKLIINLLFLALCALTIVSCETEGCTDPYSENFDVEADTDDGSCVYAREKFLGAYNANTVCDSYSFEYTFTITESSTSVSSVVIYNLIDGNNNIKGEITGSGIAINDTVDGLTITGTGSIVGSTLTISLVASGSGYGLNCNISGVKQ